MDFKIKIYQRIRNWKVFFTSYIIYVDLAIKVLELTSDCAIALYLPLDI